MALLGSKRKLMMVSKCVFPSGDPVENFLSYRITPSIYRHNDNSIAGMDCHCCYFSLKVFADKLFPGVKQITPISVPNEWKSEPIPTQIIHPRD